MKSGSLYFLEPSGPLQAGNGADCFSFLLIQLAIQVVFQLLAALTKLHDLNHQADTAMCHVFHQLLTYLLTFYRN
jgi:hypothetical protein